MIPRLLIALGSAVAVLSASVALAATALDVNKADQAGLEALKGVGPAMSTRILDERKKGPFKSWEDLIERVRGIGAGSATKLAAEGLTVNGTGYANAGAGSSKAKGDSNTGGKAMADTGAPKK
jgi:competence protein ComEA